MSFASDVQELEWNEQTNGSFCSWTSDTGSPLSVTTQQLALPMVIFPFLATLCTTSLLLNVPLPQKYWLCNIMTRKSWYHRHCPRCPVLSVVCTLREMESNLDVCVIVVPIILLRTNAAEVSGSAVEGCGNSALISSKLVPQETFWAVLREKNIFATFVQCPDENHLSFSFLTCVGRLSVKA